MNTTILSEDMKTRIVNKIVRVIHMNHNEHAKKIHHVTHDRINIACPYCGDSTVNMNKKRGNLYWKDLYYHCYNCGMHKSLDIFLNDFNENFEGEDRVEVVNFIKDNHKNYNNNGTLSYHLFDDIKKLALPVKDVSRAYYFKMVNKSTPVAYDYLKKRLLHYKLNRFGYNEKYKLLYILNLTPSGNITGLQVRSLDPNYSGPKYRTYNLEKMYAKLKMLHKLEGYDIDELNKISMIFNILTVNINLTFTIFEGPIDSFFMQNTIALCGVKKNVAIPTARYLLDNDETGVSISLEKLSEGYPVFMWKKLFDDYNINEYYKDKNGITKKIVDFNDLVIFEYKNRIGCLDNLDKYFTKDRLDSIYI